MSDVIVIGAGWGGLTAAAILAHNGIDVQVLEATGHIGGRSAYDRKNGFLVDYGIHIIGYGSGGAAAAALREIGHEIEFLGYGEPQIFADGKFSAMPTGTPTFLKSRTLSFSDKMIIGHGVRRLLVSNTAKHADVSVEQFIPGSGRETVRQFWRILCMLGLVAPDIEVTSAAELAKFLRRAMRARVQLSYPRGGASQINEALAAKIREKGDISFNSRVKEMTVEGDSMRSVTVHDKQLEARAFVYAAPVAKLPELMGDALEEEYRERCQSLIPASGISLDLCLSKPVSDLDSFFISPDPMMLGQFTSNIDTSTAPEGKQLATFFRPIPYASMDDHQLVDAAATECEEKLEEIFPGITEAIEWQRLLKLKLVDGFEPRVGQTAKDRPGLKVAGADNLFLAGDATAIEGKSGDVAFKSGVAAAKAVLELLG